MSTKIPFEPRFSRRSRFLIALVIALLAIFGLITLAAANPEDDPYEVTVSITDITPQVALVSQPVTISVKVTANDPGAGTPGGQVEVKSGNGLSCLAALDAGGEGACALTFAQPIRQPLKATYTGLSPFLPGVSDEIYLYVVDENGAGTIYTNDFERSAGDEWCLSKRDTSPSGQNFLGQFNNDTTCLTFEELPAHIWVTVEFDLYVIRSWDGNVTEVPWGVLGWLFPSQLQSLGPDEWTFSVDGEPRLHTTFSNWDLFDFTQAYPGSYPGSDYPARSGALSNNTLGYYSEMYAQDSIYHLRFHFDHTSQTLQLDFAAQGLQPIDDESWGLDNVSVKIGNKPLFWVFLPYLTR